MARQGRGPILLLALLVAILAVDRPACAAEPRRVLLLHSFGRDFNPYNVLPGIFRAELVRQSPESVDFYEFSLETSRFEKPDSEAPITGYLKALFEGRRLDLVVPIGAPAAQFAQRNRADLFPETPMLFAGTDWRHFANASLTSNDALVPVLNQPGRVLETILQVLPQTTNIVVLLGSSPIEKFWSQTLRRDFQPFTNRLAFEWLDGLPFPRILERCAKLPPRSVIFWGLLIVDGDGAPCPEERVLPQIRARANVPIFGIWNNQLGRGVVGGLLMDLDATGENMAHAALRILQGESPTAVRLMPQLPGPCRFDWRELQRWGVREQDLPAGSIVQFRQPSFWEQHRRLVIGVTVFCLAQAGSILGLLFNAQARKRAVRALGESEEINRATFEQAAVGIAYLSLDQHWLRVNDRLCAILHYTRDELSTLSFERVSLPEDMESHQVSLRRLLAGETKTCSLERQFLTKEHQLVWTHSTLSLIRTAGGEPRHFILVLEDISEQKRAEVELLRQRNELTHIARVATMGELAASLAHELNQPLGAILANAETAELLIEKQPLELQEIRVILSAIRRDDERASEVISRLRAIFRKEGLERQPLDFNSVVNDVWTLISRDAVLRGIVIAANLDANLPPVAADRVQLQQVLLNLILNSMDSLVDQPEGRRKVVVQTRAVSQAQAQLTVADSGAGIKPEDLPRVFQPFFTTKPNGMGMGLSISRTIVEAHRGRIWAENNPSGGASFHILLPAAGGVPVSRGTAHAAATTPLPTGK